MPCEGWCGKSCAECANPCQLDESMPCSPSCELLGEDGTPIDDEECIAIGCDAYEWDLDGLIEYDRLKQLVGRIVDRLTASIGKQETKRFLREQLKLTRVEAGMLGCAWMNKEE